MSSEENENKIESEEPIDVAEKEEDDEDDDEPVESKDEKEKKHGVVYLSRIPQRMNVKILREYMSQYGKVGRIYLEPLGN